MVTSTLLTFNVPTNGRLTILTAPRVFGAGLSIASVRGKSLAAKILLVSSMMVTELFPPVGASLTGVTSIVMVFAEGSSSTPKLAVPPSSCTLKVKLA